MAFSLASIFGGGAQPQQAPQQQQQPTGQSANTPQQQAMHGQIPANLPNPPSADNPGVPANGMGTDAVAPLDDFKELWQTTPNDPKSDQLFNIDQGKFSAAVGKLDFARQIKPELLQAISQGGDAAAQALPQVMNQVAQQAFMQSTLAIPKIVEQALAKHSATLDDRISQSVKKSSLSDGIKTANPALSHPSAQPIVAAIQQQLIQKYPNASPSELNDMANKYLSSFADVVKAPAAKQQQEKEATSGKGDEDWGSFFS